MEAEGTLCAGIGGKGRCGTIVNGGRLGCGSGHRHGIYLHCLGEAVGTSARGLHVERHWIIACLCVCVADGLSGSCLSVAKTPLIIADVIANCGAGELCGVALANAGGREVRGRQWIDGDGLGDNVCTSTGGLHIEGHLISASSGKCMVCGLPHARLTIAEVPLIAFNTLPYCSAGELCGFALANGGGIKACCWSRIYRYGLGDVIGASAIA